MQQSYLLPIGHDIAPDGPIGGPALADAAGAMLAVDGTYATLYAVSNSAGIWKSKWGLKWIQLPNSPSHAYSIAVDPAHSAHLAVGERGGDSISPTKDSNGAWESTDGGLSWKYVLDPRSHGAVSQVVPSVAFTPKGTLVMATEIGIFIKPAGGQLTKSTLPQGQPTSPVTAIVPSATKVWARLRDFTLLVSTDDGLTWEKLPAQPLQAISSDIRDVDLFSLGAWDSLACMTATGLPRFDQSGNPLNATTRLVIWDVDRKAWIVQDIVYDSDSGNEIWSGAGNGGRRFLRSYDGLAGELGKDRELFLCNCQQVFRATGRDTNGFVQFVAISGALGQSGEPTDPVFKNLTHCDTWGFHWLTSSPVRASGEIGTWIANDGGIYENRLDGAGWHTRNEGLHTHNAHVLVISSARPHDQARLTYVTQDNCEWWWDPVHGWVSPGYYGDVNYALGDAGNPLAALFSRNLATSTLTGFGVPLPTGLYPQFANSSYDYARFKRPYIQFIQTLYGELPFYPYLDAVMLVKLPLQFVDANQNLVPAPAPLGTDRGWALIRNKAFAQQPDVNQDKYASWELVAGGVPRNTLGFWVSGGHAHTTYYAYSTHDPDGTGAIPGPSLLVRELIGAGQYKWRPIFVGDLMDGEKYGPAHVNPFNPNRIFVLTSTGIMSTSDGGATWNSEDKLTSLLTEDGRYPFAPLVDRWNAYGICGGSHANPVATLSHMAFNRYDPNQVVAASPFTGVFFNDGAGQWRDLSSALPRPLAPVSNVGIDNQAIYVALEGRSVVSITLVPPYISGLLGEILHELVTQILYGVIDDRPGVVVPPHGGPRPGDPIGPILRRLSPRRRDEIIGWALGQVAPLLSHHAARSELYGLARKLLKSEFREVLARADLEAIRSASEMT